MVYSILYSWMFHKCCGIGTIREPWGEGQYTYNFTRIIFNRRELYNTMSPTYLLHDNGLTTNANGPADTCEKVTVVQDKMVQNLSEGVSLNAGRGKRWQYERARWGAFTSVSPIVKSGIYNHSWIRYYTTTHREEHTQLGLCTLWHEDLHERVISLGDSTACSICC